MNNRLPTEPPEFLPLRDRQSIQVISRAADILRTVQAAPDGLSLAEIASLLRLPRSTVQRIVESLAGAGLVVVATSSNAVRLGPALIPLGEAARLPIADLSRHILDSLALDTEESVGLLTLENDCVVVADFILATHRLISAIEIGTTLPLHCSASGKAILAAMDKLRLAHIKTRIKLHKFTDHTLTSWSAFSKELGAIRESGLSFDREEHTLGVCSVAIALRTSAGDLAALVVSAPKSRFADSQTRVVESLRSHANKLQQLLILS